MQLNEIIENNTLEQISRRTRLTTDNLEKLFSKDFKGFTKVQALGFISILEREYRADLSSLRQECLNFFDDMDSSKPDKQNKQENIHINEQKKSILLNDFTLPKKSGKYIKPVLVVLAVAGLLFAAWQTYSSSISSESNTTAPQQGGFFTSMIKQTKNWIGSEDENSIDQNSDQNTDINPAEENSTSQNSFVLSENPKTNDTNDTSGDFKTDKEKSNIIKTANAGQDDTGEAANASSTLDEIKETDAALSSLEDNKTTVDQPLEAEVPSIVGGNARSAESSEQISGGQSSEDLSQKSATADIDTLEKKQTIDKSLMQQQAEEEKRKAEEKARKEAEEKRKQEEARKKAEELARQKAEARKKAEELARKKAEEKRRRAEEERKKKEEAKKRAAQAKAAKEKAARLKAQKAKEAARKKAARLARQKAAARAKAAKLKAQKLAKAKQAKAKKEQAVKSAKYVIKPSRSIWLGIVDLRTMSRRTYTGTGVAVFNKPNGRWIVATNHGHFSFRAGSRKVSFNDNRKHYLIIQNGNIHEIPHATFQKLNKSKAW